MSVMSAEDFDLDEDAHREFIEGFLDEVDLDDIVPEASLHTSFFGFTAETKEHVFHRTTEDALESILEDGSIGAMNASRGLSNRGTGAAIFASAEDDAMGTYGDISIEINLDTLRDDNPDLDVQLEEPLVEVFQKQAAAHVLERESGIDLTGITESELSELSSEGITEDTLVIYGAIPIEYTKIYGADGDVVHTGDKFDPPSKKDTVLP
jgi:hypothetical protein